MMQAEAIRRAVEELQKNKVNPKEFLIMMEKLKKNYEAVQQFRKENPDITITVIVD